jgi:hypothetical protein
MKTHLEQSLEFARGVKILLTPGFSPVLSGSRGVNRFSSFAPEWKPLKRLARVRLPNTGLQPGVNKMDSWQEYCFLRAR